MDEPMSPYSIWFSFVAFLRSGIRMQKSLVTAIVLLTIASCDGEPSHGADSGAPDGGEERDGGEAEPLYDPPELPIFTPCPSGWREQNTDGVTTCEPWPEGGRQECSDSEAHFPGEAGCRIVGAPCPEGDWAEDLPADTIYVRSGAPPGGTGTRESPFDTVALALGAAHDRATIALAKGTYEEVVRLERSLAIRGACASETVISLRSESNFEPTVTIEGGDVTLADVRVGGRHLGIRVASGLVQLEGVIIDGVRTVGLLVEPGAAASGHDVLIREVVVTNWDDAGHPSNGDAIGMFAGATVDLDWVVLDGNWRHGIILSGEGAAASLAHTYIGNSPRLGRGAVYAERGALLSLESAVIEGVRGVALSSLDQGTLVSLQDVIVRNTESTDPLDDQVRTDGQDGRGLLPCTGGAVEAVRLLVENNRDVGVLVSDRNSTFVATDLVIRDTRSRYPDGTGGRGLSVQAYASAVVSRALIIRNREAAVSIFSPDTVLELTDAEIRDTRTRDCVESSCPETGGGVGLGSYGGGHADVTRFRVLDSVLAGVQLAASGSDGRGGTMDLHEGEVAGSPVGVNIQNEDFNVDRLMDQVYYRDNGRNLDTEFLPVPDPM